ncbi:MAG: hypothetical protein JWN64_534 [Parcubacteria group bacterium]|nr:hypothetical protein [Parcubacteria group bacterium]
MLYGTLHIQSTEAYLMAQVALYINDTVHVVLSEMGAAAVNSFDSGAFRCPSGQDMVAGQKFECILGEALMIFGPYARPGVALFADGHIHLGQP